MPAHRRAAGGPAGQRLALHVCLHPLVKMENKARYSFIFNMDAIVFCRALAGPGAVVADVAVEVAHKDTGGGPVSG